MYLSIYLEYFSNLFRFIYMGCELGYGRKNCGKIR